MQIRYKGIETKVIFDSIEDCTLKSRILRQELCKTRHENFPALTDKETQELFLILPETLEITLFKKISGQKEFLPVILKLEREFIRVCEEKIFS
jgi:hypothetical protein